jgi:hypothetical protein
MYLPIVEEYQLDGMMEWFWVIWMPTRRVVVVIVQFEVNNLVVNQSWIDRI